MDEKTKVTFVTCDMGDWEGIYVNKELFVEGHRVSSDNFLKLIAVHKMFNGEILINGEILEINLSDEQMEELGYRLPNDLEKVLDVSKRY
ncbi:hypothetical protein P8825_15455 [Shouchella clausii]|uniref:hypothetical protein n=1 Tax=Shouchella clausii TaxID=79880 RepID=UPI002DBB06C3|nr:hypothetical protein [Shouchella clausii]MEB5480962.1 hypothetical protein [Shouchella clausii]